MDAFYDVIFAVTVQRGFAVYITRILEERTHIKPIRHPKVVLVKSRIDRVREMRKRGRN